MKKIAKISFACFTALAFTLSAQVATKQVAIPGTPSYGCHPVGTDQKGPGNTVQNGNGSLATTYTVTQCGLGFTAASVRLNQRSFSATPPKGVAQPAPLVVSGIPPCFTIVKAFLYVGGSGNGVAITATIKNPANVTSNFPMTMIGQHTDKCWGYSGTYNYRADVTSCITGNGTYTLSGIPCLGTTPNDMDGATLFVIYSDPSQTFTGSFIIADGCKVAQGGSMTQAISGFNVCGAVTAGSTQNFVIVSDLQQIASTPINLNSATANYTYPAASNNIWDYIQQPGAPAVAGQTSATYGFSNSSDCYNFVACGMYFRTACLVCSSPALTVTPVTSSSCSAGSATANVAGGTGPYSYTWSPTGGNAQTVSNVPTGNYTVTVADATGCNKSTATIAINAAAAPTIAIASNTSICPGQSANLTASGGNSYTWTPSASLNTATGPNVIASPAATQIYSVTGTNTAGCIGTQTVQVTVNPLPVPNIGSNSPVCFGTPINLTSGGGNTYAWSGPNAFSSTLQNPTIPSASSVNIGVYNVTVTSVSGCTATTNVNVNVITPTTSASNTGPYCAGQTMQLNSPSATSYAWSGPSAFSSSLQNPTIANATTGMTGTYTIIATVGGCTVSATTFVTVNALPTPIPTNTGPYCPGNTIQLNVPAYTSYTWTGPSSFSSNNQNPTQSNAQTTNSGNYIVTVTDANGCVNSGTTNVVVNPTPVVNISSNSPVCVNTSINLTASGGSSYSWSGPSSFSSTNQNPTIPNAQVANAGVYTVTVTALGCTNVGTTSVTVTTPTTSASNTGPYCAGAVISLSATAATSYTWSGPGGYSSNAQNATQPASTPAMSGTYSVIVTIGTCTAAATTSVTVNPLPVPTAAANSPVCVGQTINLTGGGGGTTYTWTGPGSYNSNSQSPSITNAQTPMTGNYILTVTDANGCVNSANVNVLVNALPVITVNSPTNCVNTTIGLTATGGTAYAWTGPNSFSSTAQNPSIPSAQLPMSGTYVVTVTDANGCVNTANTNVTVLPLPNPNITSNSPVCAGQILNLQGTGGATYQWSGPGYSGPTQNPTISNVNASAAGVYTLLVSSGSCTASTTYTVIVNPVPVFSFANTNVLCNGQSNGTSSVNVTVGTSPYSYTWTSNPPQNSANATALPAGTYSCIVTDANGCTTVASTVITQPTPFSVSINSTTLSACAGSPINVLANASGGTGPYTYTWTSGPSTSMYSITENSAGNYNYVVNALDNNGCTATNNINLTYFPLPTVTATSATYCAGGSAQLTASGANTYTWQPGNIVGSTYPYSGNTSVNVTVIGEASGCSNSANASVIVNPSPNAAIATGGGVGCVPTCMTFTGNGSSNITSYNWTLNGVGITGNQVGSYCFTESASYSLGLSVMDNNGCTATAAPVTLDIYPQPVADFNHSPIKPIINIDQEVTFTDASWGANIVSWNWYFMNTAQYTSTLQNPTFQYTEPGTYAVVLVVKSDKGCLDTIIRPVEVGEDFGIYVPNAFTPNGDGLNDVFHPKGFGIVKYELNIFDRWGEKVFHTDKFEEGWDGKFQGRGGNLCEEGTYTWLINCTSVFNKAHELKGHVTLMK